MSEDVQGLPDVPGLAQFVAPDIQDNVSQATQVTPPVTPQVTPQAQPQQQEVDWAQFKNKDGSLNHEALLKSYKEIQGYATKVSQENKQTAEQMRQMQEQLEIIRLSQVPQYQAPPQQQPQNFDSQFIADPQSAVQGVAQQVARQTFMQAQVESVLVEEQSKNPAEFQERYNYAMMLRNQYPQLTQSAPGVKKLFQIADQVRTEELKKQSYRAVNQLFGEGAIDKLSALLAASNPNAQATNLAYMPDTTLVNRTGTEPRQQATNPSEMDAAVQAGDIDAATRILFKNVLAR